jgi:hypothetical protein
MIDHDDELLRGGGHDFFLQQRAAAAFHEIQRGIDLVRSVDGDIDHPGIVGLDQGNAGLSCQGGGVVGGRDSLNREPGTDTLPQS